MDLTPDKETEGKEAIDEQLLPYLNSPEPAAEEHLHRLFEKARPIVYRIARSVRMGAGHSSAHFNTQDIFVDVCIRLLPALQQCKNNPKRHPISNFAGLVATATSSVFSDILRAQDRQKRNLKQKIRRLIAANSNLAVWQDRGTRFDKGLNRCVWLLPEFRIECCGRCPLVSMDGWPPG